MIKDSVTEKFSVTAADGKILKSDVLIAKSCLNEKEYLKGES